MPSFRWSGRSSLTCAALCLLLSCFQIRLGQAVTPLTDWRTGIATNYGGPLDGKNPYDPSWGTITVRSLALMKPDAPSACTPGLTFQYSGQRKAASTVTYFGMIRCLQRSANCHQKDVEHQPILIAGKLRIWKTGQGAVAILECGSPVIL